MTAHDDHDHDVGDGDGANAGVAGGQDAGDAARRGRLLVLLDDDRDDRAAGDGDGDGDGDGRDEVEGWRRGGAPRRGLLGLRARLDRVCAVTAARVGVDGAGVTVMGSVEAGRAGHRDQLAAAGALTRRLEDLQLTAGEGPCLDAHASGAPVLVGDLAAATTRWVGFAPEALAAGAAAVFSLPLQVGAVRLGTLDLHRATVGSLSGEQLADALALAVLATEVLLELADTLDPSSDPDPDEDGARADLPVGREQGLGAGWLPDVHAEVHMASGMVSARHGIDVRTALLRIRGYAFAFGEPIRDVARRILDHDGPVLDGDPDQPEHPEHPGAHGPGTGVTNLDTAEDGPPAPGPSPDSSPEGDD